MVRWTTEAGDEKKKDETENAVPVEMPLEVQLMKECRNDYQWYSPTSPKYSLWNELFATVVAVVVLAFRCASAPIPGILLVVAARRRAGSDIALA
jgi:hypothetical protein